MNAFVVADSNKTRFRGWGDAGPEWVDTITEALRFADRESAEKFCRDDEDAWHILPINPVASVDMTPAKTQYFTRLEWFSLPMKLRQRWWKETNFGKSPPPASLLADIEAAKKRGAK